MGKKGGTGSVAPSQKEEQQQQPLPVQQSQKGKTTIRPVERERSKKSNEMTPIHEITSSLIANWPLGRINRYIKHYSNKHGVFALAHNVDINKARQELLALADRLVDRTMYDTHS